MKKIFPMFIIGILIISGIGAGAVNTQKEHNINKNDIEHYKVTDEEKDVVSIFGFKGPIINRIFQHLDMHWFSIYEDIENPDYLYMLMKIDKVRFTELRSLYNIIWEFNGLMYCTGMHTLNSSDTILDYSAYYESDGTEHKIWSTDVDINEKDGVLTWTISKNDLGLKRGDVLENPWAHSVLMTKKWESIFKIKFAEDKIDEGPNYVIIH